MPMIGSGYTWAEIKNYLFTLSAHILSGETLEVGVFGGCTVLHWGMEDRLSRDLDVLYSECLPNLVEVAQALSGAIRFTEGGESEGPYVEVAPMEANAYLPRFTVYERIEIAPNLNQLSCLVSQIPVRQTQLGEESLQKAVQQMEQRLHENPAEKEGSEPGQRI